MTTRIDNGAARRRPAPGVALAAAVLAAAALAGCGSGPRAARFHSLLPPPQAAQDASAPSAASAPSPAREAGRAVAWSLAPTTVPVGLDRPQWVVRAPDGTLAVLEDERWIAPLADDLGAALAERLARSLGPSEAAQPSGRPRWRIAVDVRRFESRPAHSARIDAAWSVAAAGTPAGRGAPPACSGSFEQPVREAGYPALAEGHRRALAQLARAVAATVDALDRGETPACPR